MFKEQGGSEGGFLISTWSLLLSHSPLQTYQPVGKHAFRSGDGVAGGQPEPQPGHPGDHPGEQHPPRLHCCQHPPLDCHPRH